MKQQITLEQAAGKTLIGSHRYYDRLLLVFEEGYVDMGAHNDYGDNVIEPCDSDEIFDYGTKVLTKFGIRTEEEIQKFKDDQKTWSTQPPTTTDLFENNYCLHNRLDEDTVILEDLDNGKHELWSRRDDPPAHFYLEIGGQPYEFCSSVEA